jgi:hypothetical protein
MNKLLIKINFYEIIDKSTTKVVCLRPGPNKLINITDTYFIYTRHFDRHPKFIKKHIIIS